MEVLVMKNVIAICLVEKEHIIRPIRERACELPHVAFLHPKTDSLISDSLFHESGGAIF